MSSMHTMLTVDKAINDRGQSQAKMFSKAYMFVLILRARNEKWRLPTNSMYYHVYYSKNRITGDMECMV